MTKKLLSLATKTVAVLSILSLHALGITLEEAIKEAEKNPQYLAEKARILEAQADVIASKAYPNPTVDYEGSNIFKNPSSANRFSPTMLIVAQPILIWGKRGLSIDASRFNLRATEKDVSAIKLLLIESVKDAFYNVLAQEKLVEIAKTNLELTRDILKAATRLYEEGETALGDQLRASSEVAKAERDVIEAEKNLNEAKAQLNFVLGRAANQPISTEGEQSFIEVKEPVEALIDRALNKRPELKREELTLGAFQKELSLARRLYLPDPAVGFITEGSDVRSYGITFGISIPIFYQGQGEIAKAKAQITREESNLAFIKNQITLEVKNAYTAFEAADDQIKLFQENFIPNAQKSFDLTNKAYRLGEEMIINLFEARRTLIEARKGLVEALLDYNRSQAALERAVGEELIRR